MKILLFTILLFSVSGLIAQIKTGAEGTEQYLHLLKGKKIALTVNHTSIVDGKHLVDCFLDFGLDVVKIMAPEHGFRGKEDAAAHIDNSKDEKTGIPIISLHGDFRKPPKQVLEDVDIVVFDIQDLGVRFYTYISTMTDVMEACAEAGKDFLILDRPNPNGHYVDGPVLEDGYRSFLGRFTIPIVYGMTMGEYAMMVNEEGWMKNGIKAKLTIINCEGYDHNTFYELPVRPSPNIPNMRAVYLYPSLGLFEGTNINAGRGTEHQFQVYGHSRLNGPYSYTPKAMEGAKHPKQENKLCHGEDLTGIPIEKIREKRQIDLSYLINAYQQFPDKSNFFIESSFNLHAGNALLMNQIKEGLSELEIRKTWQDSLNRFKQIRKKYLIYKDFDEKSE